MRASRLLSILLTLSVRGQVSAAGLAEELEVSVRTIYRDVDALSAAGIPVYCTRGRHGGVRLLDGYRTRLTGLTPDETDALFLSGVPGAAADLGLGGVLAASQLKLLAALPADVRERAARVRERFLVDSPGWLRGDEAPPNLSVVADAAWSRRLLDVRYERADRTVVDRMLAPYGLVLKGGTWYVVADRPDDDRGPRTYRVSRVRTAAVRDETFTRPAGFELEAFWTDYQRDYTERVYRESALIKLDATGRHLVFLLGEIPARAARDAMSAPDADDWATTTVPVESLRHAEHALLQLGDHVEVLAPTALREAMAATARALVARYG